MKSIPSPCIKVCSLNEAGLCIGCGRTIDEITDWGVMTDREKVQVLNRLGQGDLKGPNQGRAEFDWPTSETKSA